MARREEETNRRMELIPMVDIVFLLLIYFLVSMAVRARVDPSYANPEMESEIGKFLVDLPESGRQLHVSDSLTVGHMIVVIESLDESNGHFNIFFLDQKMMSKDSIFYYRDLWQDLQHGPAPAMLDLEAQTQRIRIKKTWKSRLLSVPNGIAGQDFDNQEYRDYRSALATMLQEYVGLRRDIQLKDIHNVMIEADRNTFYRVVYDLLEEFDGRGIRAVDFRFKIPV